MTNTTDLPDCGNAVEYATSQSNQPRAQPPSEELNTTKPRPHVRFGNLPKPDHSTGKVISVLDLRSPAFGRIAQRRVETRDERGEKAVARSFRDWQTDHPKEAPPSFESLRWVDEPHPGSKAHIKLEEDEVSPKTLFALLFDDMRKLSLKAPDEGEEEEASVRSRRTTKSASTECCCVQ